MTKTEQVYGGSLYDLAQEEGLTEQIGSELKQVTQMHNAIWGFAILMEQKALKKI